MNNSRVLALIPARSGSKGIPGKNTKYLSGKPLIAWTIQAAKKSKFINEVVVSTDCPKIASVAKEFGASVPFIRPPELALDTSTRNEVVLHALNFFSENLYDYVILLQPTSPLRSSFDIDSAFSAMIKSKSLSCVSVCQQEPPIEWIFRITPQQKIEYILSPSPSTNRQDSCPSWKLNGAIYIANISHFRTSLHSDPFVTPMDTYAYCMCHSKSLDLDSEWEWPIAELLMDRQLL